MADRNTTVYRGAENCVYNDEGICDKGAITLDDRVNRRYYEEK